MKAYSISRYFQVFNKILTNKRTPCMTIWTRNLTLYFNILILPIYAIERTIGFDLQRIS